MANSRDFVDFVLEQMSLFGVVSARRMFGGHGLYCDGLMFALIADDRLYLKTDAEDQPAYAARQLPPFAYQRAGQTATIASYHEAPPEVFDERSEMLSWARRAHAAALRSRVRPAKGKAATKTSSKP